jgi:hypothetical protein
VLGVVLGNDEQVARLGADFLDGGHRGLHGQRQHRRGEVVPAARKQVGFHRGQLEPGIADVDRGVERRGVLHPLQAKPAFDGRHGVEHTLLKLIDFCMQYRNLGKSNLQVSALCLGTMMFGDQTDQAEAAASWPMPMTTA